MHLSRIVIENFRNFSELDVALDGNVVVVGENKVGKSNRDCCINWLGPCWCAGVTLDLSRFCAAPSARLGHLPFEGDRAFPT
jgi:hypothetical protein